MNKKKYIPIIYLLTLVSFFSTGQIKNTKISKAIDIPFQIINGYFVKNTFTNDHFPKAKITTQEEFDNIFGAAAFMGENGTPTAINCLGNFSIFYLSRRKE